MFAFLRTTTDVCAAANRLGKTINDTKDQLLEDVQTTAVNILALFIFSTLAKGTTSGGVFFIAAIGLTILEKKMCRLATVFFNLSDESQALHQKQIESTVNFVKLILTNFVAMHFLSVYAASKFGPAAALKGGPLVATAFGTAIGQQELYSLLRRVINSSRSLIKFPEITRFTTIASRLYNSIHKMVVRQDNSTPENIHQPQQKESNTDSKEKCLLARPRFQDHNFIDPSGFLSNQFSLPRVVLTLPPRVDLTLPPHTKNNPYSDASAPPIQLKDLQWVRPLPYNPSCVNLPIYPGER